MKLEERDWTIPLIYLFTGIIWIGLSDELLFYFAERFILDSDTTNTISQWKGFFYVILTTFLLYYLIKRKTKTLESVKNDFRRLFQENPNPMYIFEINSQDILLANKAAGNQYGYFSKELSQLNLKDLRPSSEVGKLQIHLQNLKEDFADSGEWLHRDRFGNHFYVNIYSHKTLYKDRECRLVNAININKKILAELERENFERALDKAASVSITNITGNIEEVNSEFCRVSGYQQNELIGKPIEILESGFHDSKFWNDMWAKIKAGQIWRADLKNKNKEGHCYWVDIVISPIKNHEGKIYKFMSISYDITEKKDLEINQQKLLDDFTEYAFQTSHELRGPLTSMMGLAGLFERYEDPAYLVAKLKSTAQQMDVVIRKMNDSLSRTALDLILKKRDH
ncbi:PAS domain S-box-containing protein [Marivirga sericea]|uniref:histidine kinase n=1 Tax=Marivirga sericea TaxID=1028 RepID=A0A1X7JNQ0_9BACT|nr:PAS domain S-box protein [Marivirga sericea]SMG29731.1 PAS domain S-box-containing protein [Marivirga sericea]